VVTTGRRSSDRTRSARVGAALYQAEKHYGPVAASGLTKLCPRCDRVGWVFHRGNDAVLVVWEGAARNRGRPHIDAITVRVLLSPEFGCHGCAPGERKPPDHPGGGKVAAAMPTVE